MRPLPWRLVVHGRLRQERPGTLWALDLLAQRGFGGAYPSGGVRGLGDGGHGIGSWNAGLHGNKWPAGKLPVAAVVESPVGLDTVLEQPQLLPVSVPWPCRPRLAQSRRTYSSGASISTYSPR